MASFPVAAMTIVAGQSTFGPVTPGAGFNRLTLVFDIGSLVDPCTFVMRYADDGINYRDISAETYTAGSAINRNGTPMVPPNVSWSPNLGSFGDQKNLTTAISKVQIVITNTTAFHTNGGTLTVT